MSKTRLDTILALGGDRWQTHDIPAGMECGATCSGPSGHPNYGGLICGALAVYRDLALPEEALEYHVCEQHRDDR